MTLYPHLYHQLSHTGRTFCISKPPGTRSYRSSNKPLSRSVAVEAIQETDGANHEIQEIIRSDTTNRKAAPSRMLAQPKRSGSVARNDSPLFSRRSVGRKWIPGSSLIESPKYRVVQDLGVTVPLSENAFNPFSNYATDETIDRLAAHPDDKNKSWKRNLEDHWTINSLFAIDNGRPRLWRNDTRKIIPGPARMTLDEAVTAANDTVFTRLFVDTIDDKESEFWRMEHKKMDKIQLDVLSKLMQTIENPISSSSHGDFSSSILQLGRVTLLKWGLPIPYVDLPTNALENVRTGLDALVSVLSHSPGHFNLATLVELLERDSMIQLLDQSSVGFLQSHITREQISNPELEETIIKSLKDASEAWKMRNISIDQWKIQTSRFRIQLAIARETGVMPSEHDYVKFMRCCLRADLVKELELTFLHYLDFHPGSEVKNGQNWGGEVQAGESVYREYIKGLIKDGRVEQAQEVLNGMKRRGIIPSVITYGVMFDVYGRQLDLRKMRLTLKAMNSSGHFPNLEIYTSLIANYVRAGDVEKANQAYFQLLRRPDIDIDPQCKNVIENLMRIGGARPVHKLQSSLHNPKLFKEKQQKTSATSSTLTPPPDPDINATIRFNHRLKKAMDSLDTYEFIRTYKKHKEGGVVPNTTTLNIVISALLKGGQLESSLDVLKQMKTMERAQPDVVTFATLLNGAVNQKTPDLGWQLYSDMRSRYIEPNLYVYVSLMELAALDPTNKQGRYIAKKYAIRGDNRIRFPITPEIEERTGLNFAAGFYNQLCLQGLEPNHHIFCTLLDIASAQGLMRAGRHVYQEMIRRNIEPNTAIMTSLIKGFASCGDFKSGWRVWKHMIEKNIPRNTITYHHLIRLCKRSTLGRINPEHDPDIKDEPSREPENDPRIPTDLMTEIQNQMKVDHVDWSRVRMYRKKEIDHSKRLPTTTKVGFVAPAIGDKDGLVEELIEDTYETNDSLYDSGLFKTTNTPEIRELISGGGDMFELKRMPTKKASLLWDPVTKEPVIAKDYSPYKEDANNNNTGVNSHFICWRSSKILENEHITAAYDGAPTAQYELGCIYFGGNGGVPQDYVKAMEWYLEAANHGHSNDQYGVGDMYYSDQGVPQDHLKAMGWFLKSAANQGNGSA
ncbi:hypothetical protein BGZ76_008049 [Entomortierella beljakovae]|nr:hypothetical protein BGZ76_008049 [Entomortierella beljakovae]